MPAAWPRGCVGCTDVLPPSCCYVAIPSSWYMCFYHFFCLIQQGYGFCITHFRGPALLLHYAPWWVWSRLLIVAAYFWMVLMPVCFTVRYMAICRALAIVLRRALSNPPPLPPPRLPPRQGYPVHV